MFQQTAHEKDRIKNATWLLLCPFLLKFENLLKRRKYKPQFVINLDEVSTSQVIKGHSYQIKVKDIEMVFSCNPELLSPSSILLTTSSDGEALPMCIILPYANIPSELTGSVSPNFRIYLSPKGFMTKQLLFNIFKEVIVPSINERRQLLGWQSEPSLVIADGHTSRNNPELLQVCAENNIDLVILPSHLSHIIQPNDSFVNAVFKNSVRNNDNVSISLDAKEKKINFMERIKEACSKSLINTTICESWKSCGINLLDPTVILKQCHILTPSFIPSTFTDIQNICWMMNKMQIITRLRKSAHFYM
jgi:hypothetical protein